MEFNNGGGDYHSLGQTKELNFTLYNLGESFVKYLRFYDPLLLDHSKHVAEYSRQIAIKLGLKAQDINRIFYSGLSHDIGKTRISKDILYKSGPLDYEEINVLRIHPIAGKEILEKFPGLETMQEEVLYHHKHYSGEGYPTECLNGKNIPLGARIIAVADAFDAMTSARSYRKSVDNTVAFFELQRCSGSQFDPQVVEAFRSLMNCKKECSFYQYL